MVNDGFQSIQLIGENVKQASHWIHPLRQKLSKVIVGQKVLQERLLTALIADSHVLLEGVPGLAKTLALKSLASLIQAKFHRIQFTPDMLPADIIGTEIYNPRELNFVVKHGPLFANFILADEINRAPAKVQSALLEAMQERQVTIGEKTYSLASPFLVMATQNPIEQEGTYPLPEAQVDRFMLKVVITFPSVEEERKIIDLIGEQQGSVDLSPIINVSDILSARKVAQSIYVDEKVKDYIVSLVYATRAPKNYNLALDSYILHGASPRATLGLLHCSRAAAFLDQRGYVSPQDVKSIAMDVLRHRVNVTYEAEAENIRSEDVVQKILDTIPVP